MTIEAALEKLAVAVEANTSALHAVLAASEPKKAAITEEGEKKTRKTKETKAADTTSTEGTGTPPGYDTLKDALSKWLGQFAKPEDKTNPEGTHPEVIARKAELKKAFTKLGVENLTGVTTEDQVTRLGGWLEKAKAVDKGFGAGRFAEDPVTTSEEDDDTGSDDLDL